MDYLLGYDIGSSSIKAALVNVGSSEALAVVQHPESEMTIATPQPGWAEQDPESWWDAVCTATKKLLETTGINVADIKGIGISYQMHGLVVVDKHQQPLRPAIIWCDSRAVDIGNRAFVGIGPEKCLTRLLNSPGNFTASKLAWVKENEPDIFGKIDKFMLPGDYIAMRLTGEALTTACGLSEGILWDFSKNAIADITLDYFGIAEQLIPAVVPTFSLQGEVTQAAAKATGLRKGIPVTYRAGDQPNNAMSLNVLQPGEVAATGGTSGVVYGVLDQPVFDPKSRVNSFLHVNHRGRIQNADRIGMLLCINGAGSQYAWVKKNIAGGHQTYQEMERMASQIPIGSDGLCILPFGNGAERMLENSDPGARIAGLNFNRHGQAHLYRAALEGIAFSFVHGIGILKGMGLGVSIMRVGNDNLFRSQVFADTIANLVGCIIEVVETTGAVGAAKAAGVATGVFGSVEEAMAGTEVLKQYIPQGGGGEYADAYRVWGGELGIFWPDK